LIEEDSFNQLGFGLVSYRSTIWNLFLVFCTLSVVAVPSMYLYSQGSGYADSALFSERITLGNLGYSRMQCQNFMLKRKKVSTIVIACRYGKIGKIHDYGIQQESSDLKLNGVCVTTPSNEKCKPTSSAFTKFLDGAPGSSSLHFDTADSLWAEKPDTECTDPKNSLFVQYSCEMDNVELYHKYRSLCMIVALGVLICVIYFVAIVGMKKY